MSLECNFNLLSTQRGRDVLHHLRLFVDDNGYPVEDFGSFRKLGPPYIAHSMREPARGSEIFVSGIPVDAIEDEIFDFFSGVGQIYDMRLVLSDFGEYNRGCVFIRFFNPDQAKEAITYFDKKMFRERHQISVQKSLENNRLYVCGLPYDKTKIEIWNELTLRGVGGVTDVIVYKSRKEDYKNRGFAFVEFENHGVASMYHRKYHKNEALVMYGRRLLVDWSLDCIEVDRDVMSTVSRLFFRNLPTKLTRKQFTCIIARIIDLVHIEKIYKSMDYAFIHFRSRQVAEYSLKKLLHYFHETDVEVTWSIPPEEVAKAQKMNAEQKKVLQFLYNNKSNGKPLFPSNQESIHFVPYSENMAFDSEAQSNSSYFDRSYRTNIQRKSCLQYVKFSECDQVLETLFKSSLPFMPLFEYDQASVSTTSPIDEQHYCCPTWWDIQEIQSSTLN